MKSFATAFLALTLSGCAGFTFYSDKELQTETAIPVPRSKPYLLVVRTGAKDKPIDAQIVYISDYSNLIYAKPNSGFGSSNLSLAFANGQMTAFGQQTDTKIPELVTSLSGLITARAGADKTYAEADQIRSTLQAALSMDAVGKAADAVAKDIAIKLGNGSLQGLTGTEPNNLTAIQAALASAAGILLDATKAPLHAQQLDVVREQSKALGKFPAASGSSTPRDAALQLIASWKAQLDEATKEEKAPEATFELYEIKIEAAGTRLLRVIPSGS